MNKLLLASIVAMLSIMGCKKTATQEIPDDRPSEKNTKLLDRYVINDGATSVTYQLEYDSEKRLTQHYSVADEHSMKIFYDDRGNAVKFEIESQGISQEYVITYNEAGVPLTAMHTMTDQYDPEDPLVRTMNYEVAEGKIRRISVADQDGNNATIDLTYTGENITQIVRTYRILPNPWITKLTLTFGSKKSPFLAGRFKYPVIQDLFADFSSVNEIRSAETEIVGSNSLKSTHEYQYDSEGYPTSSVEKNEQGNVESTTTFHYR